MVVFSPKAPAGQQACSCRMLFVVLQICLEHSTDHASFVVGSLTQGSYRARVMLIARSPDRWPVVSEKLLRVALAAPPKTRRQKSSPLAPAGNVIPSVYVEALEMALFGSVAS
jgi:hypothetical protein